MVLKAIFQTACSLLLPHLLSKHLRGYISIHSDFVSVSRIFCHHLIKIVYLELLVILLGLELPVRIPHEVAMPVAMPLPVQPIHPIPLADEIITPDSIELTQVVPLTA
jgi:hypothetical protein